MNALAKLFAKNANAIMEKKGWAVGDLVSDDLPQSTAYRILRGNVEPTLRNAVAMADALDVNLDRLIN